MNILFTYTLGMATCKEEIHTTGYINAYFWRLG